MLSFTPGTRVALEGFLGPHLESLHQRLATAEVTGVRTATAMKSMLAATVETAELVRLNAAGAPAAQEEAPARASDVAGHAAVRKRSDLRAEERRQLYDAALAKAAAATADSSAGAEAATASAQLLLNPSPGLAATASKHAAGALELARVDIATVRFLVLQGRAGRREAKEDTVELPFAMQPGWLVPGQLSAAGGYAWMPPWDKWMAPDATIASKTCSAQVHKGARENAVCCVVLSHLACLLQAARSRRSGISGTRASR